MPKDREKLTDDMQEYRKCYRIQNEDKIKEKIKCTICSGKYQKCSKYQHLKSNLHKTGEKIRKLELELSKLKIKNE